MLGLELEVLIVKGLYYDLDLNLMFVLDLDVVMVEDLD